MQNSVAKKTHIYMFFYVKQHIYFPILCMGTSSTLIEKNALLARNTFVEVVHSKT